jgi:hypothetical protein
MIFSSEGTPIAPVVLRTGISSLGVLKSPYSIIQCKSYNDYKLLLYGEQECESPESIKNVVDYLKVILGKECRLDVQFLPRSAMLTARAKHRTVIRERS